MPVLGLLWLAGVLWAGLLGSGLLHGAVATDLSTMTAASAKASDSRVESSGRQADASTPAIELLTSRVATLEAERARLEERLGVLERETAVAGEATGRSLPAADVPEKQTTPGLELHTGGRDLYNCHQFASWDEAQAVLRANTPGDPNHIDADGNGIACEALRNG